MSLQGSLQRSLQRSLQQPLQGVFGSFDSDLYNFYTNLQFTDKVSKQRLTTVMSGTRYNYAGTAFAEDQPVIESDGKLLACGAYTNLITWSEDISDADWDTAAGVIISGTDGFKAQNQYDWVREAILSTEGVLYTLSFSASVESGGQTTGYSFMHNNSASGHTTAGIELSTTPTTYSITILGRAGGGSLGFGLQDNNTSNWAEVTITDFQVTETPYLMPYVKTEASQVSVPVNNSNVDRGYKWPIGSVIPELDNDGAWEYVTGTILNSGNLISGNYYEIITTEADHFGAGVVIGDRVTSLTTALDANNTVKQIQPSQAWQTCGANLLGAFDGTDGTDAQGDLIIPWTPRFNYDDSSGTANILSPDEATPSMLYTDDDGTIVLADGTTPTSIDCDYQANTPYQINAIWGTHPTETFSAEKVVNGGFDTDTDWDKDSGWTIGAGVATCDGSVGYFATNNTENLVAGTTYKVSFDIVNRTAGAVYVYDGVGANIGSGYTTVGTHTREITALGGTVKAYSSSFNGSIDNVSFKALDQPKMQLIVTDLTGATGPWESDVVDFDGSFDPGDYLSLGWLNDYPQDFGKIVLHKAPDHSSWQ